MKKFDEKVAEHFLSLNEKFDTELEIYMRGATIGAIFQMEEHMERQSERLKEIAKTFVFKEPVPTYTEEEVENLLNDLSTFLQVKGFSTKLEREWFNENKKK